MHEVLMRLASQEHVKREDFTALAERMPCAVAIGAAALEMDAPTFLAKINAGELKPLPILLAMAKHIENRESAH